MADYLEHPDEQPNIYDFPFNDLPEHCDKLVSRCELIYKKWPTYLREKVLEFLRATGPIIAESPSFADRQCYIDERDGPTEMAALMGTVRDLAKSAERDDIQMLAILSTKPGVFTDTICASMQISNELCSRAVELYHEDPEFYNIAHVAEHALGGRTFGEVLELFPLIAGTLSYQDKTLRAEWTRFVRAVFVMDIEKDNIEDMTRVLDCFSIDPSDVWWGFGTTSFIRLAVQRRASKDMLLLLASRISRRGKMTPDPGPGCLISEMYENHMRGRGLACDPDVLLALSTPPAKSAHV